jgi:hypothetical protein
MPGPIHEPVIFDEVPTPDELTSYNRRHFDTYLRLLDADAEGAELERGDAPCAADRSRARAGSSAARLGKPLGSRQMDGHTRVSTSPSHRAHRFRLASGPFPLPRPLPRLSRNRFRGRSRHRWWSNPCEHTLIPIIRIARLAGSRPRLAGSREKANITLLREPSGESRVRPLWEAHNASVRDRLAFVYGLQWSAKYTGD